MHLSIGMIVKNEEKYLERCLTALKPILDNLDSELIIADTGSIDNTVEIAKRFTEKVYFFEWINDFSAARNFTLEKSSGEWFMFIDADEILRSCDELISFFKSGKYKSYGSASFVVHSFADEDDPSKYVDSAVLRLTKRYSDVHFENAVHEAIVPLYQPTMYLDTVADHYGYYYQKSGAVTEQAYAKSKRNLEMLLKRLDESTVDYNIYKEIADCYQIIADTDNSLKYVDMGLELLQHNHIAITQYYDYKAGLELEKRSFDEVIEVCDDYFKSDNDFRKGVLASDVDMYAYRAQAYYFKKLYDKTINDLQQFFKVYREYKGGRLKTDDLLYNQIQMNDASLKPLCKMLFESYIALGKYNTAAESFKLLPLEVCADDENYMFNHFIMRADVMEHTRYSGIKKYALQLDEVNRKRFFKTLRWKMFGTEKPAELIKAMKDASGLDASFDDAVQIFESYFIRNTAEFGQIEEFVKKHGAWDNEDIFCIMLGEEMDIAPYLIADDIDVNICTSLLYSDYADRCKYIEDYDIYKISAYGLEKAETFFGRAMVETLRREGDIIKLFTKYGEVAARWQNEIGSNGNISAELKAGIIISKITSAERRGDKQTCVAELRRLINEYPEFAPYASKYVDMLNAQAAPKNESAAELMKLAAVVKQNINSMIIAGNYSDAKATLLELEKLCPNDPEIAILKNKLIYLK